MIKSVPSAPVAARKEHQKYERLVAAARGFPPIVTAVAHPCDESSLRGAMEAAKAGLITPILVGPQLRIRERRGSMASFSMMSVSWTRFTVSQLRRRQWRSFVTARPSW
jgi:hypothetical protein